MGMPSKSTYRVFLLCLILFSSILCSGVQSQSIFEWQSSNIQLSTGNTFELGPSDRTIITFEHLDRYRYGDNYLFYDFTTTTDSYYAEWRTRLSLSRISGKEVAFGPITDVLVGAQLEFLDGGENRQGYGIGLALDVPGFQNFGANFLSRDDPRFSGRAGLLVFNWRAALNWGAPVNFEGFCDIQEAEGEQNSWVHCQPRLLLDIGHFYGRAGEIFGGIEYQYWSDKFGAGITSENALQAQLKLLF